MAMTLKVSENERISRFLLDKGHIRTSDKTVKYNAFMPPKTGKLSVYRTEGVAEAEIWNIGQEKVAAIRKSPLIGRADLLAQDIFDKGLDVVPETSPHPLHADIVGWEADTALVRLIALKLAATAKLILVA